MLNSSILKQSSISRFYYQILVNLIFCRKVFQVACEINTANIQFLNGLHAGLQVGDLICLWLSEYHCF